MRRTAKPLTPEEVNEMRLVDASIWEHCSPSYMNLVDRLICDVSSDTIPEPEKGKILLKIRQIGRALEPYSN